MPPDHGHTPPPPRRPSPPGEGGEAPSAAGPDLDLLARLTAILSDVTGAPVASLGPHSTPQNTPGWDSLANLAFLTSVEDELGVSVSTADLLRLRSLGDLLTHVRAARGVEGTGAQEGAA